MSSADLPLILHIDSGAGWRGGQAQVWELLKGLETRGVRQRLICPIGAEIGQMAVESGIDVDAIPMRGEWDLRAPGRIANLARRHRAGLLHAHASLAHGLCWRALRRLPDLPLLVTRRVDFAVGGNWLSRAKYRHPATQYIAISTGVKDALMAGGVAGERIDLVPSGIDPERFTGQWRRADLLKEFDLSPDAVVVGNIGALTDHKGQRYLIDAAQKVVAECPRARFFICGEGELRGELERRIVDNGLENRVILAGHRPDVEKFLAAFDIYAHSSHLEGLGTSVLDAMWFRLPVVATRAGGLTDVVGGERNGLLVAAKDSDALAAAILRLIAEPETRQRLGEEGRRTVEERFTAERMVEGTLGVYCRVAGTAMG